MIDLEPIIELAKCREGRVRGLQREREREPQTARQTRERAHRKVREDREREMD